MRRALLAIALVASAAAGGVALAGSREDERDGVATAAGGTGTQPNIVVIITDDQRAETLRVMPEVEKLLSARGATFTQALVNFSLCCPSRATLLTGQYAHNHGVLGNDPPEGGFEVFQRKHGNDNLVTWLRDAGYRTSFVGKYFNGYGERDPRFVPPGWDRWLASTPPGQRVYDYELNRDGRLLRFGNEPRDYKEDVLSNAAVQEVGRAAPSDRPFFLTVSYTSPHVGGPKVIPQPPGDCGGAAKPAPRHAHGFDEASLPMGPDFNEPNVSDKPPGIADLDRLDAEDTRDLRRTYRCYLESLLAVDDGVGRIVEELRQSGELGRTLIIFTSDNGFFFGEHRVRTGKVRPHEPSIDVPLVIRGPGVRPGRRIGVPVMNVDLAPTMLDAAGLGGREAIDGMSLLPVAGGAEPPPRDLLLESRTFSGLRTNRYAFVDHVAGTARGSQELYDLRSDPYELRNLADLPRSAALQQRLMQRLRALRDCSGESCRASRGP